MQRPSASTGLLALIWLAASAAAAPAHAQAQYGTRGEAVTLVSRALMGLREDRAGTLAAITARAPRFTDRDLYVVVYDLDGQVQAHGQTAGLVGRDLSGLRDINGVAFVQERIALARRNQSFWHEYAFVDPLTRRVLPKSTYCERLDELIVCAGVYLRD